MTTEETLDKLEEILVKMTRDLLNDARKPHAKEITYDEARNMVGNIGTRILFGKDIYDTAFQTGLDKRTPRKNA
jgi:hypothetical protein